MSFYLQCIHTNKNTDTCQQQRVGGTDKNPQMAWVHGVLKDGQFTATQIGNDKDGNLIDETTGTGAYTSTIDQSGVQIARDGSTRSSSGIFVNGTDPTTIRGSGEFQGFTFTFYNSKLEAGQTSAGLFAFRGTPEEAGAALNAAGFAQRNSSYIEPGHDVYRSRGSSVTGANSAHFNVQQMVLNPRDTTPQTRGNMHFGEYTPFSPLGWVFHSLGDSVFLNGDKLSPWLGVLSLLFSAGFWVYMYIPTDVPHPGRYEVPLPGLVAALALAFLLGVAAVIRGSKWWLAALLGPACGAMLLLSLRA
jgi:hypothetical protein